MKRRISQVVAGCLGALIPLISTAEEAVRPAIFVGRPISEIIDELGSAGLPVAYSSNLLPPHVTVVSQPEARDPVALVKELLEPHGLTLEMVEGLYLVTRRADQPPGPRSEPAVSLERNTVTADPPVEELVVAASRYEILRELLGRPFFIDRRSIQHLPDLGDDPVRAVHRLPGAAAGGTSAKVHIRGGEEADTGIVLNGQRLLDPFHIRDYQNLFSAIDVRAVEDIEVYTGGFPVRYGDRMGGLLLIDTLTPQEPRHTEIGLSVFNTSVLSSGTIAEGRAEWLASARRGNLDLILDEDMGEPQYSDFFGETGLNLTDKAKLSLNVLLADDQVVVVTENDPTEREESTNDTRNAHFWMHWDQQWTDALGSATTLATSTFDSLRIGLVDDPEKIVGGVQDRRAVTIDSIGQDWDYELSPRHRLSWGAEFQQLRGRYDYSGFADYFGSLTAFPGLPASIRRELTADVEGDGFSAYLDDRWQLTSGTTVEVGLRWDKQGYTDAIDDEQFSPRLSLLHALGPSTHVRASWGRYHQSQGIHELQIEDGINTFYPAQRSEHLIAGLQHQVRNHYSIRVELYRKTMDHVRPRYENLFDPLAVIPELEPDRIRVEPENAVAEGLELSLGYDGPTAVGWWLAYTLSRVEDTIMGRRVPRSWDQRHALQAGLSWNNKRWDVGVVANVHTGWPKTTISFDASADAAVPSVVFGERNAQRFGSFASLDLRASREVPVRMGSLSFFLEVSNATNRKNACCVDFDLDEDEQGNLILDQKDDYWLPLLPSVGVLWEF